MSGGFYVWPSLAEVNTRARRYVSAWIKHQKREESKQAHMMRVRCLVSSTWPASRAGGLSHACNIA